jgi:hypothetical protein
MQVPQQKKIINFTYFSSQINFGFGYCFQFTRVIQTQRNRIRTVEINIIIYVINQDKEIIAEIGSLFAQRSEDF